MVSSLILMVDFTDSNKIVEKLLDRRKTMLRQLLFLLLMSLPLFASVGDDGVKVTLFYYNDTNQSYDTQGIVNHSETLFTQELVSPHLKFPPNTALFIKLRLENHTDKTVDKVVKFLDIRLDKMDLYSDDGQLLNSEGDRVPFSNRKYDDAQIAVNISAKAHSERTFYLKFSNEDKMDLSYIIYDKSAYVKDIVFKKVMHAFFFGALLIMLIYNIVLYLFIREKAFLVYILYHITVMIVMLYYNGIISQYYHPDDYGVNGGNVPAVLSYLSIILAIEFLRYFLNAKEYTPKMDRWLLFFVYLNTGLLFLAPFDITSRHIPILNMMFLSIFLLYISGYHAFVLKRKIALFYLLGWLVMLVAIIITGLLSFGYVERNDFTAYIFQVGIVIEITLLSMGLAYRYKVNQDDLIEKRQLLHEQSKLAAMGEMMRHISHQWRQPLSEINAVAMTIETEYRRNTLDAQMLDKNIEAIENITEHMSKTIQDFNGYFKSYKKRVTISPKSVIIKAVNLVYSGMQNRDVEIGVSVETPDPIKVVEGELIQVLLVLLNNARDILESQVLEERWIKVNVRKVHQKIYISVEDNGGGIKEENLSKVFEPYFTTKFEAQGTGIGLYMSKMIVEESLGGSLRVVNGPYGAKFTVVL